MSEIKDKEESTSVLLEEENKVKIQYEYEIWIRKNGFEMGKAKVRQDSNTLSYLKKMKTGKEDS